MNKGALFDSLKNGMNAHGFSEQEIALHLQHYTEKFATYSDEALQQEIAARGGTDSFVSHVVDNRNNILLLDSAYCEAVGIAAPSEKHMATENEPLSVQASDLPATASAVLPDNGDQPESSVPEAATESDSPEANASLKFAGHPSATGHLDITPTPEAAITLTSDVTAPLEIISSPEVTAKPETTANHEVTAKPEETEPLKAAEPPKTTISAEPLDAPIVAKLPDAPIVAKLQTASEDAYAEDVMGIDDLFHEASEATEGNDGVAFLFGEEPDTDITVAGSETAPEIPVKPEPEPKPEIKPEIKPGQEPKVPLHPETVPLVDPKPIAVPAPPDVVAPISAAAVEMRAGMENQHSASQQIPEMPTISIPYNTGSAADLDGTTVQVPLSTGGFTSDAAFTFDPDSEFAGFSDAEENAEPKPVSKLRAKTYTGPVTPEKKKSFRTKVILLSPLYGAAGAIAMGGIFLVHLLAVLLIPLFIGVMLACCVAGLVVSLTGLIYGTSQVFIVKPIGLYEIGLGIIALGVTLALCVLIYNFAVRLIPKLAAKTWALVKLTWQYICDLYCYCRGECYRP